MKLKDTGLLPGKLEPTHGFEYENGANNMLEKISAITFNPVDYVEVDGELFLKIMRKHYRPNLLGLYEVYQINVSEMVTALAQNKSWLKEKSICLISD